MCMLFLGHPCWLMHGGKVCEKHWSDCLCLLQEKNVGYDSLEGKVGRIYMPKQDLNSMALNKMKVFTTYLQMLRTTHLTSSFSIILA